jgi:hypothetical protein
MMAGECAGAVPIAELLHSAAVVSWCAANLTASRFRGWGLGRGRLQSVTETTTSRLSNRCVLEHITAVHVRPYHGAHKRVWIKRVTHDARDNASRGQGVSKKAVLPALP